MSNKKCHDDQEALCTEDTPVRSARSHQAVGGHAPPTSLPPPVMPTKDGHHGRSNSVPRTTLKNVAGNGEHLRAETNNSVTQPSVKGDDITAANNTRKTITINGVDIADYQRRLQSLNKKTTPGKKKTTLNKGGRMKKTAPSSDNNHKITNFFSTYHPPPKNSDTRPLTSKEDSGLCNDDNNIDTSCG